MSGIRITGLHVYPVKSMRGIALNMATLTARGFLHDRIWMVVDSSGRFVTQRSEARLALVSTRLDDSGVVLSLAGHGSVHLPIDGAGGDTLTTSVWGDSCMVVDEGERVSRWLTNGLGSKQALRIVRMAPGFTRPQSRPERFGAHTTTWFADSAPFLAVNEASLDELNRALMLSGHAPVPIDRFRPNVVLGGLAAFAEHDLGTVSGGHWRLGLVDRCERCVVTTIDQRTAAQDPEREPWQTLRRINPAPGPKRLPAFGQNAVLESGEGQRIALGDRVAVSPRQ